MGAARRVGVWGAVLAALAAGPVLGLLPLGGPADVVEARVVAVQDGDTLTVRTGNGPHERVRLVEIDAPEKDQAYGEASKRTLGRLVHGRAVRLERDGEDRYGRTLARVFVADQDVNKAMVRTGAAWVYDDYSKDAAFPPLQAQARAEKAGLWALQADPIVAPWEWRRGERGPPSELTRVSLDTPAAPITPPSPFQCGAKRLCSEMASCEEAIFHLKQCGLERLDRDDDGAPCERVCSG